MLYGTGFRHHCPRGDGTAFEIVGEPRGGAAYLSIRAGERGGARAERRRGGAGPRRRRAALPARRARPRAGDGLEPRAPTARSPGRTPPIATASTRRPGELPDHRIADAFGHVLEEVPLTAARRRQPPPGRGARPRGRRAALVRGEPGPRRRPARPLGFALDGRRPGRRRGLAPPLRRDADRDLRAPADRARGLRQEPPARALQPGADRPREDRRGLARRPAALARLPRAAARDPADARAEGLRLLAAQALRARGGRPRGHLRGELAAALGQDLPRHRPAAPAGRAGLPVRGHLDGDPARAQVPLRARAQPGDARPHVRGGGGLRRLGHAGLRQLRLRGALGPRPDGSGSTAPASPR